MRLVSLLTQDGGEKVGSSSTGFSRQSKDDNRCRAFAHLCSTSLAGRKTRNSKAALIVRIFLIQNIGQNHFQLGYSNLPNKRA